jgi:hypothetical protein
MSTIKKRDAREEGRIILAHGEVTGHAHEVVTADHETIPTVDQAQFFEFDGVRELIVLVPCVLRHQEHAPITLDPVKPEMWRQGDVLGVPTAPGVWRIERQREWSGPDAWRQVAD